MVIAIVDLATGTGDDAPCAAVGRARGRDGVFVVIAMRLGRQQAVPIAEDRTVLMIGKGPAGIDQRKGAFDGTALLVGKAIEMDEGAAVGESGGTVAGKGEARNA